MSVSPTKSSRDLVLDIETTAADPFDPMGGPAGAKTIETGGDNLFHVRALYLDLELTCWNVPPPLGMKPEIIEIGLVEMDLVNLHITRKASCFVRPRRWEISDKCAKLTGITSDEIRKAKPFDEALPALLKKFGPTDALCCTWGDDVAMLNRACTSFGLISPFTRQMDLCKLFQSAFVMRDQPSLGSAIKMMGLEFDGVPHDALADARNTALLHAAILRRMRGLPDLPRLPVVEPPAEGISPFAQKLKECLKGYPARPAPIRRSAGHDQ